MRKMILICLVFCIKANAGVNADLEKAFNNLGGLTNTTKGSAYKGQAAGYYNAGSLYARSPVHNTQLASVDFPSFSGGCGGIDLHLGGFSFISKSQARELTKQIMADGVSYAFNLAMETVSPMLLTVFKDLRNVAERINNMNISSCEESIGLVGSVFPKTQAAQQALCRDIGAIGGGMFNDYVSSRMGCGNEKRMGETLDKAKSKPEYKKTLLSDMNFAWKAIKGNSFLSDDDELAELFMSVTGTMIVINPGDEKKSKEEVLPTLVAKQDLLKTLLHGGKATIYKCDKHGENECLHPTLSNILTIDEKKSLIYSVEKTIRSISKKLKSDDSEMTASEKGFIESTRLPIFKMMTVQTAMSKDGSILDVASYAEFIATDILFAYLDSTIDVVEREYQVIQIPAAQKEEFQHSINTARQKLQNLKIDNYKHQEIAMRMINQSLLLEKRLAASLKGPILESQQWAESL